MGDLKLSKNGKNNWEINVPIVELLGLATGAGKLLPAIKTNSPSKVLDEELEKKSKKKKKKEDSYTIPTPVKAGIGIVGSVAGAVGTLALSIWAKDKKTHDDEFLEDDGKDVI